MLPPPRVASGDFDIPRSKLLGDVFFIWLSFSSAIHGARFFSHSLGFGFTCVCSSSSLCELRWPALECCDWDMLPLSSMLPVLPFST